MVTANVIESKLSGVTASQHGRHWQELLDDEELLDELDELLEDDELDELELDDDEQQQPYR